MRVWLSGLAALVIGCSSSSTNPEEIRAELVLAGTPPAAPRTFVSAELTNRGTDTFLIGGCTDVKVQALSTARGWVDPDYFCSSELRFTPVRPGETQSLVVEAPIVRGPGLYRLWVALFAEGPDGLGVPRGAVAVRFTVP